MLSTTWLSTEQQFLHQRVMLDVKKLDREQLVEIFGSYHQSYLLRNKLFTKLVCWCVKNGFELPPITDLLEESGESPSAEDKTQ
jgi:hypothetical protein